MHKWLPRERRKPLEQPLAGRKKSLSFPLEMKNVLKISGMSW